MSEVQATGKIVQCIGAVVDVEFPRNAMPKVYDALKLEGTALTLEVQQQLGDGVVRTIALGSSDGLRRGLMVSNTGAGTCQHAVDLAAHLSDLLLDRLGPVLASLARRLPAKRGKHQRAMVVGVGNRLRRDGDHAVEALMCKLELPRRPRSNSAVIQRRRVIRLARQHLRVERQGIGRAACLMQLHCLTKGIVHRMAALPKRPFGTVSFC